MNDNDFNSQFYNFDDLDCFDEASTSKSAGVTNEGSTTNLENGKDNAINSDSETEDEEEHIKSNELLWSIEDDTLFHAFGLINHSTSAGKSVFVTWNESYLQNFIFKKSSKTKQVNMTKVRLTLPDNEEIKDILILDYNTLLLMHSGSVYYLSSVKSMHVISWLTGVRCIAMASEGFSVIRLLADNTLSLEVYRDIINIGNSTASEAKLCAYDITFDAVNLFNCQWSDETYSLVSLKVDKENVYFVQQLVHGVIELQECQEVHIFAVSGNVCALIPECSDDGIMPDDTNYRIELLNVYAAPVSFMKVNCQLQICLIFFECGSIDIWYISSLLRKLINMCHHTGAKFVHYAYNSSNSAFYFTDTEKVGQLQFKFDSFKDIYLVEENYKSVADILVCTWVPSIQQLICLSSNNIFYQLNFSQTAGLPTLEPTPEFESLTELYELTTQRMCKLLCKANKIAEFEKIPAAVHEAIEKEYLKQQVLAVAKKQNAFKNLLNSTLEFHATLPSIDSKETVLLYAQSTLQMQKNSLFAVIYLQLKRNDVFQASLWQLHIDYAHTSHIYHLPSSLLYMRLCIIVPLVYSSLHLLPTFYVNILTFVANDNSEYIVITLPAQLRTNTATYTNLFSTCKYPTTMSSEFSIPKLIAWFKQEQVCNKKNIPKPLFYTLVLPKDYTFARIRRAFVQKGIVEVLDDFEIYFLTTAVKITHIEASNSIQLACHCPVALHYTLQYLLLNFQEHSSAKETDANAPSSSKKSKLFLQFQCDIERFYGSLMALDNDNIGNTSGTMHLEDLKRIHTKMRTLPNSIFE